MNLVIVILVVNYKADLFFQIFTRIMNHLTNEEIHKVLMQQDSDGKTAVHYAAEGGSPEVIIH